jgi:hypothetical protein
MPKPSQRKCQVYDTVLCVRRFPNGSVTSSDKFYVGDALQMIKALVNQGFLIKDSDSLLSLPS